jgi:molybdenum ABC transporter molybdate-binding protein
MLSNYAKQLILGAAAAAIVMASSFAAHAEDTTFPHHKRHNKTNINLAVASNFYGNPPTSSAITDIIAAFEAANPRYTVTVVDNGSTGSLADHIINGNERKVDLFLAADTETPQVLLIDHLSLVTPYNFSSSFIPPLYTFNYAVGILALLSNTPGVDLSCETGTCGYDPKAHSTVAIADPKVAPYGVAAQTVLTGRYGLKPPLDTNSRVHEYDNITLTFNAVIAQKDPVGFVALSAICLNASYPTEGNGTSALAYFSIGSGSTPGTLAYNYNPLVQAGIAIRNDRTPDQNIELEDFVAFLTDFTTSPEPDSPMITTLKKYCYNAP